MLKINNILHSKLCADPLSEKNNTIPLKVTIDFGVLQGIPDETRL